MVITQSLFSFAYEWDGHRYCRRLSAQEHLDLPIRIVQMFGLLEGELAGIKANGNAEK